MTYWFETHAHLADSQFDNDRNIVIERALEMGLQRIVEIADGPTEWSKAQLLSEQFDPYVFWAAGLHPYYADQMSNHVIDVLRQMSSHPRFVALGEIGLDYAKSAVVREVQQTAFNQLLSLAFSLDKPVIVHCRNAFPDLISILKSHNRLSNPGVIHCFTGTTEDAKTLIDLGFYLGVDAPITYPSAKVLRETLKVVPLERLVLETDSPYLPPQPFRGKRNEPKYIPLIAQELAIVKDTPVDTVKRICFENSARLYRLPLN